MCNPMALGLAATALGAGLQYKANEDRRSDMRGLQRRETERQNNLLRESERSMRDNQQSYEMSNLQQAMDAAAGERTAQYAAAEAAAPRTFADLPGQTGSRDMVVLDAFRRAMGDATGEATRRGELNAQLQSFGDALGLTAIQNNRRSGDIGMIGSFMQGSANVLPLELEQAATRTRTSEVIGGLLTGLGSAAIGYGGGGAGGKTVKTGATNPKTKTGGMNKSGINFAGIFG